MVGTAIPPNRIAPARAVRPVGRFKKPRRKGERIRIPRKPSTTEGSPPNNSTSGLRISRSQRGAISDKNTAVPIPKGMAISMAPRVTIIEPVMSGRIPK